MEETRNVVEQLGQFRDNKQRGRSSGRLVSRYVKDAHAVLSEVRQRQMSLLGYQPSGYRLDYWLWAIAHVLRERLDGGLVTIMLFGGLDGKKVVCWLGQADSGGLASISLAKCRAR